MSFHRNRMNGFLCILQWDSGSSRDSQHRAIVVNKKEHLCQNQCFTWEKHKQAATLSMKEFVFSAPAQEVVSPVETGSVGAHSYWPRPTCPCMPGCTEQCDAAVAWHWAQTFPAEARSQFGQDKRWQGCSVKTHQSWRSSSPVPLKIQAGTQQALQCLQHFTSHLFIQLLTGIFLGILRQSLNLYFY